MNRKEIEKVVLDTIKEATDKETLSNDDSLRFDLGMDSVERLDLIMVIENKLWIEFSREEISFIKDYSVAELVDLTVRKKRGSEKL